MSNDHHHEQRSVLGDLALVLHQALRGPGYLPIAPRDAALRLQEDLGIADEAEPDEIESKLAALLDLDQGKTAST